MYFNKKVTIIWKLVRITNYDKLSQYAGHSSKSNKVAKLPILKLNLRESSKPGSRRSKRDRVRTIGKERIFSHSSEINQLLHTNPLSFHNINCWYLICHHTASLQILGWDLGLIISKGCNIKPRPYLPFRCTLNIPGHYLR